MASCPAAAYCDRGQMAVQPDPGAGAAIESGPLDALAGAGRGAAARGGLVPLLQSIAGAAARAAGAEIALVRVLDAAGERLVVRAVAAPAATAVELEGASFPLGALPGGVVDLDEAPGPVRRLAERLELPEGLLVPIEVAGDLLGTLELFAEAAPGHEGRLAASVASTQAGLAIRAFGPPGAGDARAPRIEAVRAAVAALAAAADAAHVPDHLARLAQEAAGAAGAVLWLDGADGELVRAAAAGRADVETPPRAARARLRDHLSLALRLGEPPAGLLQLLFDLDREPAPALVEQLEQLALRAAHVLRAGERLRALESELEHSRALLAVVGQANEQLSVAHTLETAVERVAALLGAERLAVYLLEDDRLTAAAERGLAGPHPRVAEALLELALGPFRGRGMLVVPDAGAEPQLARAGDAIAEAGIEGAIAVPLVVGPDVTGLLCVYPPRGRSIGDSEATLLAALAARLAVAVQNAQLHERATRLGRELEHALASEREAAKRLGALYAISNAFAQSLSLDVTLDAVARTVVELLDVDAAVLRMPDPRRERLLPLALHVADERLVAPVRAMLFRPQPYGAAPIQRLFRERLPVVVDERSIDALGGSHPLLLPFLEKGSTAAIVPIATPAEVLATLTLVSLSPDRPVDEATIEAALAIGGQAALAIDNARLYQQQKDFADAMQRSLLPQVRPAVAGLDIGEVYAPSADLELGGDLYDYLTLADGRLAVVLGDVTGHGIDAAADMAMAKFVFRSLAREHPEPPDFLAAANDVVVGEIASGKFITMLYLLIDPATGRLSCASAGHPPPRLVDPRGVVSSIPAAGLALGVESGVEYEQVSAHLETGGSVVLYTDGVIEARRDIEQYGVERLDELLLRPALLRPSLPAEDVAASVVESARRFTGGELSDDCAVVVLKRTS